MKATILAAGQGTRLKKYTEGLPKGMLELAGKTIIERQITTFRDLGVQDIAIVTGYAADKIKFPGIRLYHNANFETTNMVESLMAAQEFLSGDVLVSYADILFEKHILQKLIEQKGDVVVTVDLNWQQYWQARYGHVDTDTESLTLAADGHIVELGRPDAKPEEISARYLGINKFTARGCEILKNIYFQTRSAFWDKPWRYSKSFQKGYMTDLLQEIIANGHRVDSCQIKSGWLEFDTNEDYETYQKWLKDGTLDRFISPQFFT